MYVLAKRKLERPFDTGIPVPLLINLKNYNKVVDFEALITNFLNNEVGVEHVNLALFKRLNEMGQFVLLLDGFDEMARLVTAAERRQTLGEMCRLAAGRSKLVVAGRPAYFPDLRDMSDVLRGGGGADISAMQQLGEVKIPLYVSIGCLQLMAREQLVDYLERALRDQPPETSDAIRSLVERESIADLARRPVLTNMIVESARELVDTPTDVLTLSKLYQTYTDKWIQREEAKGYFRLLINPQKKADFVSLLALQMHFLEESKIYYRDLNILIQKQFEVEKSIDVDHFSHDIRTCSFLSRDDQGRYQFAHKSFMEYFVAREFSRRQGSIWKERFPKPLTLEMVMFLDVMDFPLEAQKLFKFGDFVIWLKELAVRAEDFECAAHLRDRQDKWKKRGLGECLIVEWPEYIAGKVQAQLRMLAEELTTIPRNAADWRERKARVKEALPRSEEFRELLAVDVLDGVLQKFVEG
jgi:hypothetical protein